MPFCFQAIRALQLCNNDIAQAVNLAFTEPERLEKPSLVQQNVANSTKTAGSEQANTSSSATPSAPPSDGQGRYQLIAFISHMGNSTAVSYFCCQLLLLMTIECIFNNAVLVR